MSSLSELRLAAEKFVLERLQQVFEEIGLDDDVRTEILDANKKLSKGKINLKKGKKTSDPNKPKQPQNGFMRLMSDARKVHKNEKPSKHLGDKLKAKVKKALDSLEENDKGTVSSSEMSKKIGAVWKAASDAEKKGYVDAFQVEKEKFDKEHPKSDKESSEEEEEASSEPTPKKNAKKGKAPKAKEAPVKEKKASKGKKAKEEVIEEEVEDDETEEVVVDDE